MEFQWNYIVPQVGAQLPMPPHDPADFPDFSDAQIRAGLTTPACEEKKP